MGIRNSLVAVFVILYGTSTIYAFRQMLRKTGIASVLEAWQERPQLAIIVGTEFALVMVAAAGTTFSAGWAAVEWTVAGLFFAYLTIHTIALATKQAKADEQAKAPKEKTFRRPWQPGPAQADTAQADTAQADTAQADTAQPDSAQPDSAPPDSAQAGSAPASRDKRRPLKNLAYGAVDEWRTPVPDDYSQRQRIKQHAVTFQNGVPRPQALCGYQYDPLDRPPEGSAQIWGLGVPNDQRCKECKKALRDGGYPSWDIEPYPAHFW